MTDINADAAAVARRAAEIQQQYGHCKNNYFANDGSGRTCLWGSVMVALWESGLNKQYTPTDYRLVELSQSVGPGWVRVEGGNPIAQLIARGISRRLNLFTDDRGELEPKGVSYLPGAEENDKPETTGEDIAKLLNQVADDIEFPPGEPG